MLTPVRLLAVATSTAVIVLAGAASASADAPTSWDKGDEYGWLGYVALLVGAPLGLTVLLVLFTLATSRRHFVPAEPGSEIHVTPPQDQPAQR